MKRLLIVAAILLALPACTTVVVVNTAPLPVACPPKCLISEPAPRPEACDPGCCDCCDPCDCLDCECSPPPKACCYAQHKSICKCECCLECDCLSDGPCKCDCLDCHCCRPSPPLPSPQTP